MAYSSEAAVRRRCTATRRDWTPCRGWAAWGDPSQRCGGHGGRRPAGVKKPTCSCVAYAWPHRPGGGLCRWPEAPTYRLTPPPGTHGPHRNRRRQPRRPRRGRTGSAAAKNPSFSSRGGRRADDAATLRVAEVF